MMNLLQGASDDQVALIGCFVALVGSISLMYISFFVGPAGRKKSTGVHQSETSRQMPVRPSLEMPVETPRERAA